DGQLQLRVGEEGLGVGELDDGAEAGAEAGLGLRLVGAGGSDGGVEAGQRAQGSVEVERGPRQRQAHVAAHDLELGAGSADATAGPAELSTGAAVASTSSASAPIAAASAARAAATPARACTSRTSSCASSAWARVRSIGGRSPLRVAACA